MSYNNLTQDDIDTITLFFNFVDLDKDGYITPNEINEAMKEDFNGDGIIIDDEKIAGGRQWMESNFNAQDFNADDKISLAELLEYNNK
jgi:Ca2+-binding EF-hand superfamily protein